MLRISQLSSGHDVPLVR
ncbi:unknown protein, putative [Entamoeba histolytica HM-1:IMSS-A]|uniref:Uncharacterized protein n=1 Tax=Entamoeba histolytica HM-1:IMSS-A TaxID=885318 RepID=N9TL27_ENTH1|nr:unknown protein, putative [Entamoeba histolytica HM-1:IMSS-A]